jgi:hypothetical protein
VMRYPKVTLFAVFALIAVLIFDPSDSTIGARDVDGYTPVRNILASENVQNIISLASWNDLYEIESQKLLRKEFSIAFTEFGQNEVLDAASFGDEFFNSYLVKNKISHVVVPIKSSQNNSIFHKWGGRGTITIHLTEPYFTKLVNSNGVESVSLYRVNRNRKNIFVPKYFHYEMIWSDGIRPEFHKRLINFKEIGMYNYSYQFLYSDGPDVSWVFQYPNMQTETADFTYTSTDSENRSAVIQVQLLAAYGPNAPTQLVRVSLNDKIQNVKLTAGNPEMISLSVKDGDRVKFRNSLPCRNPVIWEPSDQDWRKFCFGIGSITVRPSQKQL